MGLDMYLTRKRYVKGWDSLPEDQKYQVIIRRGNKDIDSSKVSRIEEEVGYWRKANAIHGWFVTNVQEGEDDCKEYYVDEDQLQELLDTVNKVLENSELVDGKVHTGTSYQNGEKIEQFEDGKVIKDPTTAKELLPTTEGFFFGGTEYDEYYYQGLVDTKKIIEDALKNESGGEYYYQANW